MDRRDLDDTYNLLSPLRNTSYSEDFENSFENSERRQHYTSEEVSSSTDYFDSPHRVQIPRKTSTLRSSHENVKKTRILTAKSRQAKTKHVVWDSSPGKNQKDTTHELMKMPNDKREDLCEWEDWLVKKLQAERENIRQKKVAERQAKEEQERIQMEKEHKKKQAELHHTHWCEEKILKIQLQKAAERREKKYQEELEAQKQRYIKVKAAAAYERWLLDREQKDRESKEKERQKKLEADKAQEERKQKNEECFQAWLKNAEKKLNINKTASCEPTGYPSPSYCNPVSWIGPMSDQKTQESVRMQHKNMIAMKHESIRKNRTRPQSAGKQPKGFVSSGPNKTKGVLICRPATAAPIFYNVPNRNQRFLINSQSAKKGRS